MNNNSLVSKKIYHVWLLLKITYGLLFVVAGMDKFFNIIVNWENYISPFVLEILPVNLSVLMSIVALVEIGMGLLILTKWTKVGAYCVSVWLLIIAINLVIIKDFDIAVRDVVLAICAIALAKLTEIKNINI